MFVFGLFWPYWSVSTTFSLLLPHCKYILFPVDVSIFLFMIKNVIYTRKCGHQILQHFFILSKRLPFFVHFLKSTQISRSGLSFCLQVQLATPSFISEHRYMYRTGRQIKPEWKKKIDFVFSLTTVICWSSSFLA